MFFFAFASYFSIETLYKGYISYSIHNSFKAITHILFLNFQIVYCSLIMAFRVLAIALVGSLFSNVVFGQVGQAGGKKPAGNKGSSAIDPKLGLVAQGERCSDGR